MPAKERTYSSRETKQVVRAGASRFPAMNRRRAFRAHRSSTAKPTAKTGSGLAGVASRSTTAGESQYGQRAVRMSGSMRIRAPQESQAMSIRPVVTTRVYSPPCARTMAVGRAIVSHRRFESRNGRRAVRTFL